MSDEKISELSTTYKTEYDENGQVKTDIHGNTVGFVGQFKRWVEEIVDNVVKFVEQIGTMIDVFFNTIG